MDEMTLLEDMCAAVPPPDAARLAAVRSRVLGDGGPAPERRVWPGRSHRERGRTPLLSRPRLALGGGVAVAVAAAAVVVGGLPIGGVEFAPSADAAQVLRRAAAVALTQPGPRGRQFVYTAIEGSQGVFRSAGTPGTQRSRAARECSGRQGRPRRYWCRCGSQPTGRGPERSSPRPA